jgi:hypothetical protein
MKDRPTPSSLEIIFLHLQSSAAVEDRIRSEADALMQRYSHIHSCRVVVEAPHHHRQHDREIQVKIDIGLPGSHILINHEPSLHSTLAQSEATNLTKHLEAQPDHKDVYVSIRDAFAAVRHRL